MKPKLPFSLRRPRLVLGLALLVVAGRTMLFAGSMLFLSMIVSIDPARALLVSRAPELRH